MAVTVIPKLTTIADCESTTNWTGPTPALDEEVIREGTNSISFIVRNDGTQIYYNMTNQDYSGQHIRMWITTGAYGLMKTKALGGLRFFMNDGSNTAYWNIAGSDTYAGGWINICVYADSTPDAGTVTTTSIDEIGVEFGMTASAKRVTNTWVDYLRYGDGLRAYDSTTFGIEEIYVEDATNGYGIIEKQDGVYFLSGELAIGDTGTTACDYSDTNELIVFTDKNVKSDLYKIYATGNTTGDLDIAFNGCVIKSAGPRWDLDMSNVNLTSLSIDGCNIGGATGATFQDGGTIIPNLSLFQTNTISNSAHIRAVEMDQDMSGSTNFSDNNFLNNQSAATWYAFGGTYTDYNNNYDGNIYDIENSSSDSLTINLNGTSNASNKYENPGTITLVSTTDFTLTGLKADSEVRIYTSGSTDDYTTFGHELYGVEDAIGTITYQYGQDVVTSGYNCIVMVHNVEYETLRFIVDLIGTNASIPIQQQYDRNYLNS